LKKTDKHIFEDGLKLPLIEQFYTIQGEGFHFGKAAYFIRIGGCDIGCSWCDTKFSWKFEDNGPTGIDEIIRNVLVAKADSVVVTGGEPSFYNLEPLCQQLKEISVKTFIETSGAYQLRGNWDWICLSPKRQNPPQVSIFEKADELKVIVTDLEDYEWAEENAKKVGKKCKLYLQPEWSKYEQIIHSLVDYVKKNPKWQISLQAHKFMHIP
jgi:7-carboxy-7-deazaguanine synthase